MEQVRREKGYDKIGQSELYCMHDATITFSTPVTDPLWLHICQ